MSRFARENRPHDDYLGKSYYQIWLAGLEKLMIERGLISQAELAQGRRLEPPKPVKAVLSSADVKAMLHRGGPTERDPLAPARFAIGDRVRMKTINPPTHTRLPRYVRGRVGTIELLHGAHVFPDTNALGEGENPQWLYTVCFAGPELWGPEADPTTKVSVDAWESYLDPV
jgi:nitrile hydratase